MLELYPLLPPKSFCTARTAAKMKAILDTIKALTAKKAIPPKTKGMMATNLAPTAMMMGPNIFFIFPPRPLINNKTLYY